MSCKKTKTGRESPFCKLECLASLAPDRTDIRFSYWWQHPMYKNKENSLQSANWQFCCTKWTDMKTERASRPSIQEANSENTLSFTIIWETCDLTDYQCYCYCYSCLRGRILILKCQSCYMQQSAKHRTAVIHCVTSDSSNKQVPMLIGKSLKLHCFKMIKTSLHTTQIKRHGWPQPFS